MKKFLVTLGYIVGAVVLLYLILASIRLFEPRKQLNIYVLDKTVTDFSRQEHRSFNWILNRYRYVNPDGKPYSYKKDYYGFFPVNLEQEVFDFRSLRINEVDAFAASYDIAYYTDCYGVYSFEWYKGKTKPIRSQKVYGGLNQNDYLLLKGMLDKGKLVIAEYNMFSTPTNSLVRNKTEELFGISWLGWSGKYFSSFSPTNEQGPPEWMPNLYESQHLGAWPTDKSGVVLISNDGLIEVLIDGVHLNAPFPTLVATNDATQKYGIASNVSYTNWFEFIGANSNEVAASFNLDITDEGKRILAKLNLDATFPAVIKGAELNYYYFAGDFAQNPVCMPASRIAGGLAVNRLFTGFGTSYESMFFYNFYAPLMSTILNDSYSNKE
ncbi:MAG: hypothetical protein JW783_12865 [Bacteroidales bacterium]|nr:hypothetical protein [Bacteroidales bacterium]MBN2749306.1 hypothetical protein [Bacteroidales bacterium]